MARTALIALALLTLVLGLEDSDVSASARSRGRPPANVAAPTVAGQRAVGQLLRASLGRWRGKRLRFAYRWERCDPYGASCSKIPRARSATYRLTAADVRKAIAVSVTAVSSAGARTATSSRTDPVAASLDPVLAENAQAGTTKWWPDPKCSEADACGVIMDARAEAYTSETSVAPGATLHVHVSTSPAASYRLEVYRLGWYHGLGGRLMACVPGCASSEQGSAQRVPSPDPSTGKIDANWPVTDAVHIGHAWTSGEYELKLVPVDGPGAGGASLIPFVVTQPSYAKPSAVVVEVSVDTWQAYNNWGGKSLYAVNSSGGKPAVKASFNRPYAQITNQGPYTWDVALIRYLERDGLDVSYVTDTDVDQDPKLLRAHRVAVLAGHGEYWSKAMRDGWEAARSAGVDLMFMGADIASWQVRFEDDDRTLVEYRSASADPDPDPSQKTVDPSQLTPPRPPCQLTGVQFNTQKQTGDPPLAYTLVAGALSRSLLSSSGLRVGEVFPDLVGYEYDSAVPGCETSGPLQVLLRYYAPPHEADAVDYVAPSRSFVFSSGSMQFSWALDDWGQTPHAQPGLQRLFAILFELERGY